jgi:hypothetical protein
LSRRKDVSCILKCYLESCYSPISVTQLGYDERVGARPGCATQVEYAVAAMIGYKLRSITYGECLGELDICNYMADGYGVADNSG